MTPNPIRKVLSTLTANRVQYLLMGGQACVLYGAAEFSRDTDIALLAEPANLRTLERALHELQAECVALPPFELDYLVRGHAVHFRCHHPEAEGNRLDVMATLRGVDPFPELWGRRTSLVLPDGLAVDLMAVPDLVRAKKTQRDKDWPMIRRLVEAHFIANRGGPNPEQRAFWFQEARTVSLIHQLATLYPETRADQQSLRSLLVLAEPERHAELEAALRAEEDKEREEDRAYWLPLKKELEQLRLRTSSR